MIPGGNTDLFSQTVPELANFFLAGLCSSLVSEESSRVLLVSAYQANLIITVLLCSDKTTDHAMAFLEDQGLDG